MTTNNNQTVPVIANRLTAMQAGFQKDFTAKQSLTVEGVAILQPVIVAQLGADLALLTAVANTRAAYKAAVAAKKAAQKATLQYLSQLEAALKQAFGSAAPQLADFGIKPPKAKKVLTAEEKAIAVAAAKDTKKARGIIGKNERAKITTQGKPGLALVNPQGNVVPSSLTGPTPPGSNTPAPVTGTPAPGSSTGSGSGTPSAG